MLYDLEFHDGPARSLRVYIDKAPGGVSIDDCANVSRGLNLRLDVEDVIPGGHYDLGSFIAGIRSQAHATLAF